MSRSGYYAWLGRPSSPRAIADEVLTAQITEFHALSRSTYGAPRIHADLKDAGVHVGRKRVARLMRNAELCGVHRRSWRKAGTEQDPVAAPAPDLVNRQFHATAPDQLWVADDELTLDNLIAPSGRWPLNTSGGQLAEAYMHGMNLITEGVRQLRGESVNQVPDAKVALIAAGPLTAPVSDLLIGSEDVL